MLRAPKGSERPEICDVAHSESLDMIGHLRCEWIRFRLFDMNGHSEWIWSLQKYIYIIIYIHNSKFGTAKRKNEKCKRKKHHNHQNYKCKIPGKKGNTVNIRCLSQNSWNITAKKQTHVPLKSSEFWLWCTCFLNRASRLSLRVIVPAPRPWIDCIHDEEYVDIYLASRCLQWYILAQDVRLGSSPLARSSGV